MAFIEDILQFLGVFVSFSIAYVAFRGVRQTESSTLLRLATAFVFLGFGFMVEGLVGLSALDQRLRHLLRQCMQDLPSYLCGVLLAAVREDDDA